MNRFREYGHGRMACACESEMEAFLIQNRLDVQTGCTDWMYRLDAQTGCTDWMHRLDVQTGCTD